MPPSTSTGAEPKASWLYAFLGFTAAAMFLIAVTGQPDLLDNERRVGGYILDALQNGHWMAQRDVTGDPISKPPMVTWIAATASLLTGGLTRFTLYLPSALATLGVGLLLFKAGRERFGWVAGLFAAVIYLLSPMGKEIIQTARYDGLLALPVLLAALAAHRAWTTARGWTWFWLAAAFGTLVKGPLGLALGAMGLLAVFWAWRSSSPLRPRGQHWIGLALYVLICGGWYFLGYREMGPDLPAKIFGRELIRHAVKGNSGEGVGVKFWEPTVAFINQFLPWSLVALLALWRVVKHPSSDPGTRRFERFLFCWFIGGLILFSAAAHQRSRLIYPIMPALALLTGRELARLLALWKPAWGPQALVRLVAGVTAFVLAFLVVFHHSLLRRSSAVQRTLAIRKLADDLRRDLGAQLPLTYMGRNPSGLNLFPLQFYLGTARQHVTPDQAAALLRGPVPAFVVVGKPKDRTDEGAEPPADPLIVLKSRLGTNAPPLHELARCDAQGRTLLRVVSNHPRLEWPAHTVSQAGDLRVEARDVRLRRVRGGEMWFERQSTNAVVVISNVSTSNTRWLKVHLSDARPGPNRTVNRSWLSRELPPGQAWRSDNPTEGRPSKSAPVAAGTQ